MAWLKPEERRRAAAEAVEGLLEYADGDPVTFYPESEEANQQRITGLCYLAAGLGFGEIRGQSFRPCERFDRDRRPFREGEPARLWGTGKDGTYRVPGGLHA